MLVSLLSWGFVLLVAKPAGMRPCPVPRASLACRRMLVWPGARGPASGVPGQNRIPHVWSSGWDSCSAAATGYLTGWISRKLQRMLGLGDLAEPWDAEQTMNFGLVPNVPLCHRPMPQGPPFCPHNVRAPRGGPKTHIALLFFVFVFFSWLLKYFLFTAGKKMQKFRNT